MNSARSIQPLRSILITRTSSLLRVVPPPCSASVLSFLHFLYLNFSLCIRATVSYVPYKSLYLVHAIYMPDAIQIIIRLYLNSSQSCSEVLVLTSPYPLTTLHQWITYVHLQDTHLTQSSCAFSLNAHYKDT